MEESGFNFEIDLRCDIDWFVDTEEGAGGLGGLGAISAKYL